MSLTSEKLEKHCQLIIDVLPVDARKKKIIVLCEGDIPQSPDGSFSLNYHRRMETIPDADFYERCVKEKNKKPRFFNCGDKNNVISVYNQLSKSPFINPDNLFAIVDLDLQSAKIPDYLFSNTEAIYYQLYDKFTVKKDEIHKHKIWVTGLIHKESYFLIPYLLPKLKELPPLLKYKNENFSLDALYQDMCKDLTVDEDLKNHFQLALKRIQHVVQNCSDLYTLQTIIKEGLNSSDREIYILILLTLKKAKPYWEQISAQDWEHKISHLQQNLTLQIAKFYAEIDYYKNKNSIFDYHIPVFMNFLCQKTYNQ